MAWGIERPANPSVVLVHVTWELTEETILTCPPGTPPPPLSEVLALEGVRTIDLHRHRLRVNLRPGADPADDLSRLVSQAWGAPASVPGAPPAERFPVRYDGERQIAESRRWAEGTPLLEAVFSVPGPVEAILDDGALSVRIGPLFRWPDVRPALVRAIAEAG